MQLNDFSVRTSTGQMQSLADYADKVVLIVNVASECGFTKQYAGLQALYEENQAKGFVVLGFPCDQFGHQEPGDDQAIQQFCQTRFSVTFPVFSKVEVNGAGAIPLYEWLKSSKPGILGTEMIKWNFTKFLLNRRGQVVNRYGSNVAPEELRLDIELALNESA